MSEPTAQENLKALITGIENLSRAYGMYQSQYYRIIKKKIGDNKFDQLRAFYKDGGAGETFTGHLMEIEHLIWLLGYLHHCLNEKGADTAARVFGQLSLLMFKFEMISASDYNGSMGVK